MHVIGILSTAPNRHVFAHSVGKIFAEHGVLVAVMDGVAPHRAEKFRRDELVTSGEHWRIWHDPGDPPLDVAELRDWMARAESVGSGLH